MPCTNTRDEVANAFTGYCSICGIHEDDVKGRLNMDHDHTNGAFRGWLCRNCNLLLANARESAEILRNAADYTECKKELETLGN